MLFYCNYLNYIKKNGIIIVDCINNNKKSKSRGEINMKKTNLLKVFSILVLSVMVIFITTSVNAADFIDMTNQLNNNTASNNTSGTNTNTSGTNTNTNTSSTNTSNSNATNTNTNRANNNTNTRNSSIYNNTSLPSTGIGDSLPIAALVVVFGISAVYAYKKIKDYRNI